MIKTKEDDMGAIENIIDRMEFEERCLAMSDDKSSLLPWEWFQDQTQVPADRFFEWSALMDQDFESAVCEVIKYCEERDANY